MENRRTETEKSMDFIRAPRGLFRDEPYYTLRPIASSFAVEHDINLAPVRALAPAEHVEMESGTDKKNPSHGRVVAGVVSKNNNALRTRRRVSGKSLVAAAHSVK